MSNNRIDQMLAKEKDDFISSIDISFDLVREKTKSQVMVSSKNFWSVGRWICSLISWSLYIPYFYFLITENKYGLILITLLILFATGIEIGLAFIAKAYWKNYQETHKDKTLFLWAIFFTCLSLFLSVYAGMQSSHKADSTESKLYDNYSKKTDVNRDKYFSIIESNNDKIEKNNQLIDNLKNIALTKKGSEQINRLQSANEKLEAQNESLRAEMNTINNTEYTTTSKLSDTANTEKWIFSLIFGIVGVFALVGIHWGNYVVYKFHYQAGLDLEKGNVLTDDENILKQKLDEIRKKNTVKDKAEVKENFTEEKINDSQKKKLNPNNWN